MSKKKSGRRASSGDSSATASAATTSAKKSRPRKPALVRALKQSDLLAKRISSLLKNVGRWRGSENDTEEQIEALKCVQEDLKGLQERGGAIFEIEANIKLLADTKWTPQTSGAGRKTLPVGACVVLKDNRFEPAVHGETNNFEVVSTTEKFVLIRPTGTEDHGFAVLRAWLTEANASAPEATH